jgi:hypothetical protein
MAEREPVHSTLHVAALLHTPLAAANVVHTPGEALATVAVHVSLSLVSTHTSLLHGKPVHAVAHVLPLNVSHAPHFGSGTHRP